MQDEKKRAQELALKRLARSEISAAEMLKYLTRRQISAPMAQAIVADYVGRGYISDERYAAMVTRAQLGRGKGPGAVRQKLIQKGVKVERTAMRALVAEVDGYDEAAAAKQVLERRYPEAGKDKKVAARAFAALVRRGFSFEVARASLERMKEQSK